MAKKKETKKRRFELVLPEDHWIFTLPEGERASVIRAVLDLYAGGETSLQVARGIRPILRAEIQKEFKKLEKELKEILKTEKQVAQSQPDNLEKNSKKINIKEFKKTFLDAF